MKIVPHNPLGPVSTAACLQLDAAIPNFGIQEFPSFYLSGGESAMLKEPLQVENGYILIPDKPGIGIELADDITEKFPPRAAFHQRSDFLRRVGAGPVTDREKAAVRERSCCRRVK